ncbi:retron St85 family effector protein [Peribacillus sp. FSL K6-1552]|uniref:retron St85 family effector protein n=1 Tax=Peribacillus sp. FSL K6-1552 TaxID=2954514 RepID=UPI0030FB2E9B
MNESNLDTRTKQTLIKIHDEVFVKINQYYVDVFLCGGAGKSEEFLRDRIRDKLKVYKNLRIMYPEDLFVEQINKNKDYDLLSLERFLANNCEVICVICESPGSLVELGAFVNNSETFDKVVAVVEEKKKKERSFIMLGPIRMISKKNKKNVIYYKKNKIEELNDKLIKNFRQSRPTSQEKPIKTIFGSYYFIKLLLFFYKSLTYKEVTLFIKFLFNEKNYPISEFNTTFNSALKLLFKDKTITKTISNKQSMYMLTPKGYKEVNKIIINLNTQNKTFLIDQIRFGIIKGKYYI